MNQCVLLECALLIKRLIDAYNPNVESKRIVEVANKYNLPIVVMEPVKGGSLVNLSPNALKEISVLNNEYSNAGYAVRYAASEPNVFMVLSGMSNLEQMVDNIKTMKDFKPLSANEYEVLNRVREAIINDNMIACTKCKYCIDGCPKHINIPELFNIYNSKMVWKAWSTEYLYSLQESKAKDCIKCGKCENICPQHLKIRDLLVEISNIFDKSL